MKRQPTSSELAWFGLVAYVAAFDILAVRTEQQTMSACFAGWQTSRGRHFRIAAWTILTAHLFLGSPRRIDLVLMNTDNHREYTEAAHAENP